MNAIQGRIERLAGRYKTLQPGTYQRDAQKAFNKLVKIRNVCIVNKVPVLECITCGQVRTFQESKSLGVSGMDAGHYKSVRHPLTRYDVMNVHPQCVRCNRHLGGNLDVYRARLVDRFGQHEVDRLDGLASVQGFKWSRLLLASMVTHWRIEIKKLEKELGV